MHDDVSRLERNAPYANDRRKERARFMSGLGGQGTLSLPLQGLPYRIQMRLPRFGPCNCAPFKTIHSENGQVMFKTSSPFVRKRALRSSLYAAFQHAVKIVPSAEIAVQDPLLLLLLLPTSIGDGDGGVKLKRDDASSGGEKKRTPAKLSLDLHAVHWAAYRVPTDRRAHDRFSAILD